MARQVGFTEEAPGVRSATRLTALLLVAGCLLLTLAAALAAWRSNEHSAGIIAGLAAPIAALAGGAWGAMRERSAVETPSDPSDSAAA